MESDKIEPFQLIKKESDTIVPSELIYEESDKIVAFLTHSGGIW